MRLNQRKTLMKALGDLMLRDVKNADEMQKAKDLFTTMVENDAEPEKAKRKRRPNKQLDLSDGPQE